MKQLLARCKHIRPLQVFALLVLLLALPLVVVLSQRKQQNRQYASAAGNIYYVSRNGTNADGLSWATAWNNLNQINWSVVNPGDTIFIDGGATACPSNYDFVATRPGVACGMVYNSSLTVGKSGTTTSPITIKLATDAGHNGTAVFFGGRATPLPYCGQMSYTPQTVGTGLRVGITIGAYQYVVLDGTKRSGFMLYGYDDPNNNRVNGDGLGIQFTSSSASNITVRNMEIFDNGVYTTISKSGSPINGAYNSDSKGIEPVGSNLTFERLLIHDNGQDEFQTGGPLKNVTIQDSWLYARRSNPLYPGFGFNSGPFSYGCTHEDGIQIYSGGAQSGLNFKNNIFGPGLDQGIYPSDTGVYFNNVSINNVLFLGAAWNNINSDPQSTSTVPTGWSIQNITAYDDTTGFDSTAGQCNVEVLSGSNMTVANSIFKNGCIHMSQFTGSGNVYYHTSNPVPGGTNVDPAFLTVPATNTPSYDDYASANFTPQCSACSGAGSSFHTYQDVLNDIDQLDISTTTPTITMSVTNTPTPQYTITPLPTATLTPTPISVSTNVMQNGSFENTGTSWLLPWTFQVTSPAHGSVVQTTNAESGSYAAKVSVSSSNANDWYVQLKQANLSLVAGKTYTISFWAKAGSNNKSADVVLQEDHDAYSIYLQKYFSLSKNWQKYTYTYTAGVSDTNAELGFNFATNTVNYFIDNVSVISN